MELQGIKSKEMKDQQKREQEMLSVKFKTVCKKLHETNIAFNEAKMIIKNNISHIYKTVSAISEVTEETEQNKITLEMQKLKDEKLYYMARKIKELQRENDCNVLKISKQRKQLQEFRDKYMQNHDCFCLEKKFCHVLQTLANKSNSVISLNK
jgi:cupin superfamily acireductone dioxygenase involved in methionine salvage